MISNKIVLGEQDADHAIIILPGRGGAGSTISLLYDRDVIPPNTMLIGLTPENYEWYPKPNGAKNQKKSIEGLPRAVDAILNEIDEISRVYQLHPNKITLAGFSAGGVVALETSFKAPQLEGVIVHSGALLDPDKITHCSKPTLPYLFTHSKDDNVFGWEERYLPMTQKLFENGFKIQKHEREVGGHCLSKQDLKAAKEFILKLRTR